MSVGRRPDLNVQARIAGEGRSTTVGVAWQNVARNGTKFVSVKLNPGVTLSWNDGLEISLWPAEPRALPPAREPKASSDPSDVRRGTSDPSLDEDEEIPFG